MVAVNWVALPIVVGLLFAALSVGLLFWNEGRAVRRAKTLEEGQGAVVSVGADKVEAAMQEMQDYSERRVRAAIAKAPKGTFYGEDAIDDDGITDDPLVIKARVTIADDSVEIDFEGTCGQVKRNLNCPYSSTLSAALSCVKSVLTSPDIPYNEGMVRPVRIKVPYGSLLNPRPPAPVRARMIPAYRVFNAVMKALAQALPDQVTATGFDCTTAFCLSRLGEKGYSVYLEIFGGGYGASKNADGCDAVDSPLSNCSNAPVESLDIDYDFFRIVGYELAPGTKTLPKGTRIEALVHYDNSKFNPYNPDPKQEVRWGDQTWEEMMIGFVDYAYLDAATEKK